MSKPFGEVLSASITQMVAACWQEQDGGAPGQAPCVVPAFGHFIRVDSKEQDLSIFGVVCDVLTGPRDSLHKPTALRMSRDELRAKQPQIFSLLQTEVQAITVGYRHRGQYHCRLAPLPPQVHDFAYLIEKEELQAISEDLEFVRFLSSATSAAPVDELVLSAIDQAYRSHDGNYDFLVRAGQALSQSFGNDYNRLTAALNKLKAVL